MRNNPLYELVGALVTVVAIGIIALLVPNIEPQYVIAYDQYDDVGNATTGRIEMPLTEDECRIALDRLAGTLGLRIDDGIAYNWPGSVYLAYYCEEA